jgi:hypothetical protein
MLLTTSLRDKEFFASPLVGLIREEKGVAAVTLLNNYGVDFPLVKDEITDIHSQFYSPSGAWNIEAFFPF